MSEVPIVGIDATAAKPWSVPFMSIGLPPPSGMPGENKIELTDAAVKLAIERHLSATLVPGVRVLSVDLDRACDQWYAIVTTDPPEPDTRNGAGAG